MNVLIADKFDAASVEVLRECGCHVEHDASLRGDALRDAIAKANCTQGYQQDKREYHYGNQ